MRSYADPPILLTGVIDDLGAVDALMRAQAPYTPLGGWYNPDADMTVRNRPMWFQNDWVHDGDIAPGAELFLRHPAYTEAAQRFYGAEIVEPHSVYVNHMVAIAEAGPAHTDNTRFDGRDRANTPMWLLRLMHWSNLFNDQEIIQATAIWWMHDADDGAFNYWLGGPDQPPHQHVGAMANTALLGDNHGMFHQVGSVGPYDHGTVRVTPGATLAPDGDDWVVRDLGEEVYRSPLEGYRVSVLWKANVWESAEQREHRRHHPLSMADVASIFNHDLEARGVDVRLRPDEFGDEQVQAALQSMYPEPTPIGAAPSAFGG